MHNKILDKNDEFFIEDALETYFFDLVCEAEDETYHNDKHIALKFEDGFAVIEKKLIEKFYDTNCSEAKKIIRKSLKQRISDDQL